MEKKKAAQHRLHLTAFGAGMMRRPFGRKSGFTPSCLAIIGGR